MDGWPRAPRQEGGRRRGARVGRKKSSLHRVSSVPKADFPLDSQTGPTVESHNQLYHTNDAGANTHAGKFCSGVSCRNERRLDRSRHLDFAQKLLTGRFTSSYSVTVPLLSLPYVQARSDMWMTTRRGGWALMPLKYQTVPVSS